MLTDPPSFRSHFPALGDMHNLASCSQGALSDVVMAALTEFQRSMFEHGNPWHRWLERIDDARRRFADLIGAGTDEIAIVSCASEGAYQVASGLAWAPQNTIVTCDAEFPSIAQVWLAQRQRHARVRFAETVDTFVTADGYDRAIDDSTRLVSVPLISYRHGQRPPVPEIIALARRRGAQVFIDAYQGAGVEPIDVTELDCDYLVAGALKYLLGIAGLAFLYVRRGTQRDLDPQLTGWFGRVDPFGFNPREVDYPPHARRYEIGTPSVPAAYAASAGLNLLSTVDSQDVARHIAASTDHLHRELVAMGERVCSPSSAGSRGPMVAVYDDDPARLAACLADQRIFTSPRGSLVRLAVHYYTNEADVNAAVRAFADYRKLRSS